MANLKEIRVRITSVNSTKQITSAMKMVSAAKLRRAQDNILQLRPYATKLHEILSNVSMNVDASDDNIYAHKRDIHKVLIVLITSNRGLCGSFNTNVIKKGIQLANEVYIPANIDVSYMTIGKKARDFIKSRGLKLANSNVTIFEDISFSNISTVAEEIMRYFSEGSFDRIEFVYNQFKNAAVQNLIVEQFLPIEVVESNSKYRVDYIFEPNEEYIVKELIPKSLKIQFYKAILDSIASEHGARMTAMHKATENATDLVRDLKLHYNKARQAAITKEILEVVSGAEALNG
ncbi:MAG: ATP synthase F1 subunit gamma [Bacteroidetes bacterium GWA2_30_7]|nr:MAG: ATP synthase F1 subunit gamma [Bacteroidetes bacterium GWA2_30_7]